MKKRLLSLLLVLSLTLSLLPGTAMAAVSGLLDNTPEQNQDLLEQLENFNGENYEEAYDLLDSLGLLDQDGDLITDQAIVLDGEEYTLEEIEALLDDPDTDLSQIGYVDGLPIALGDLATIIAIERELQRIQETYFSDRVFEGEAVDNLNSLMNQLQSQGISLMSENAALLAETGSGTRMADVSGFGSCAAGNTVSTTIAAKAGDTLSVDVSYAQGLAKLDSVTVTLGGQSVTLDSDTISGELSYSATDDGDVTLSVQAGSASAAGSHLYGDLTGAVHFTNPAGFVFRDGSTYTDAFTLKVYRNVAMPNLSTNYTGRQPDTTQNNLVPYDSSVGIDLILDQENIVTPLNSLIALLQETNSKNEVTSVSYNISMRISQYNSKTYIDPNNPYDPFPDRVPISYAANTGNASHVKAEPSDISITSISPIEQDPYDPNSVTWGGYPYHMWAGSSYNINISAKDYTAAFQFPSKISLMNVQVATQDGNDQTPLDFLTITYNSQSVTLTSDGDSTNPTCQASASGTYRTGQRVPILLTFDELVKVNGSGTVMSINGKNFTAADLWMSNTAGTSLLAWYPVQKSDNKELSITSISGITDVFGNRTSLNTKVPGVTLESLILRFAPTGLTAGDYDPAAGVTFSVTADPLYEQIISQYDNGQTAPFQVVVSDGTETYTRQVVITEEGQFVTETGIVIPQKQEEASYTAMLQVNIGTKDAPEWVNTWLTESFTVPAFVLVTKVTVDPETDPANYTLSMGGDYLPVLTATLEGANGQIPTDPSGEWSSSDEEIATITTEADGSGKVSLTELKEGTVTFTFTAHNGETDGSKDVKGTSQPYTVTVGDSPALNIPANSATIVARKGAAATVIWGSNADHFVSGKDFQFTIELYEGYAETEKDLEGKGPIQTYTADKSAKRFDIPADVLTNLSSGSEPAYTVRVSMPHPNAQADDIELSALAWIVVRPVPAKAVLTPPENRYLLDTAGTVEISWAVEDRDEEAVGQAATLTILRVQEDNSSTEVCSETLAGASGSYTLTLPPVQDGYLKDTYQVMLTVTNEGGDAPSTDSFPLYVYNGDALKIQDSNGNDLSSLTLDNTSKVDGSTGALPTDTAAIMQLRQELGLIEYVNINYKDYDWNTYKDGIQWATSNGDVVSVNYKQGGLYENIDVFDHDTYLPGTTMALSSTIDGTATITATHAQTAMSDSVTVDVTTLREKFYLFQFSPAMETAVQYIDGQGVEKTVYSNDDGVLALYEPDGIASDVWLSSGSVYNTLYLGTIYHDNLQSGERDTTMLQLYPLNSFHLQAAAQVKVILHKPNGDPLANTTVTIRGGAYKNGHYCEAAQMGPNGTSLENGSVGQTYTTDRYGGAMVYFDATQFWSAENGEDENTEFLATDQMMYILEITDIDNDKYYPQFCSMNGNLGEAEWMRTAGNVITLEEVTGGANKPFVARQVVDYGLENGGTFDVRRSTGMAGPTRAYPTATLKTTMFLWGEDISEAQNYDLRITDENGYIPAGQTSSVIQYPFSSIPVAENALTLSAETMTGSGWIAEGKDMGIKTRLTRGGSLVQERTLPFRVVDLTRVTPVNEDDNVSQMLVTLSNSSTVAEAAFSGGDSIMQGINGVLNDISGPINTSVFKMIITPTDDPTVFNALIWGGRDKLGLEDVNYDQNGIAYETDYLNGQFDVSRPGRSDLSQMAQGTYIGNTIEENIKMTSRDMEFKYQLTGYYEAQIRYDLEKGEWEIYTTGGGFTAGVGMGINFTVNTAVGPVPVTGSFGIGGAIQLDFQTAVRYSQQGSNVWSDPDATAVNDYLTNLRVVAYVNAFGGVGFDFSVIALKIGLYGELGVDSQNKFLSRTYLANADDRQLSGQGLNTTGEVGIKFVAKFLFISYETNLVSAGLSSTAKFNDWDEIETYWNNATAGLSTAGLQRMAAQSGMQVASASATLQSLDYLDTYARTWGQPQARAALYSLDAVNGLEDLQTNANPNSYPELSDDGQILVYVNDGYDSTANPDPSIYDSRAHFSTLSGGSYAGSTAIADPDGFTGYGDSDVDVAGSGSFAAAAWVRMSSDLPGKDAGAPVTVEEQNLLMNGTEVVASVYTGSGWTSTRLTTNGTPDLAPAVASNGSDRAVVFWRSVYGGDPDNMLDFTTQDLILYSVYESGAWSAPRTLYNGSNGSVNALEAAMLPDGTAIAVYTLDKGSAGDSAQYEVGYTIVSADDGSAGNAMLATSDEYLDENPQVVSANFGAGGDDRFVIAWHSLRDGLSDIQLLAVSRDGVMSNSFPASLSAMTGDGSAAVSASFRLATLSGSYRDVSDLTVIWDETVEDHSVLRAARLRSDGGTGYILSAPLELAVLEERTMADHFGSYVSAEDQVKAIVQATQYGDDIDNIENDIPQTKLYTATSDFALDAVKVEQIGVDYENLALNSLVPVQFVIRNTGLNSVTDLTVTMASGETATRSQALLPNESAALTIWHKVGDTVENAAYTVSAAGSPSLASGAVYLDYPDIGISRMEVLGESEGRRTVSMTLYNASPASLSGGKDREVKLAFYTDNLLTETADVTCAADGAAVNGNTITISGENALQRIDEGSFTLEATFDVGAYVAGRGLSEIPASGVYLYADVWTQETNGGQNAQQLPEYSVMDNQKAIQLTGALARTGEATTLNVDLSADSQGNTVADVTLRNNSLQPYTGTKLVAALLDADGDLLETQLTEISQQLNGETSSTSRVTFTQAGSRVVVYALTGGDSLTFEGLPVSMDDFTPGEDGTLTCSVSGISANSTLVTAVSGSGEEVTINGTGFTGSGSLSVPISAGETVITVTIGAETYILQIGSTHSSGGSGGGTSYYSITTGSANGGKVTASRSRAAAGTTVTLTAAPDEGYRLESLTVTDGNGKNVTLTDKGAGTYTFTMPARAVTVKAVFIPEGQELPFADVPAGAWYEEGVRYAYTSGLMNGTGDGTFAPDTTTSRAMIATILWRMAGSPVVNFSLDFSDVSQGQWYTEAVRWAASEGIAGGYGNGLFGTSDPITREQFATMLWRYARTQGCDVSIGEDTNILSYTDAAELSEYAVSAMQWAVGAGIVNGTGDGSTLAPQGSATRAQAAVMLMRFCNRYAT